MYFIHSSMPTFRSLLLPFFTICYGSSSISTSFCMGYLLFLSFQEPSKQCVNIVSQGSCPGFFLHHPASQDCSHFKKLSIHCILSIFTYIVMYPLHTLAYCSLHALAVLLLPLLNELMKIIDQMKERRGGD